MATTVCSCCATPVADTVPLHSRRDIQICYACLDWMNAKRDKHVRARTSGWRVAGVEPIFAVSDMTRSIEHYLAMGFDVEAYDEGYTFVHRDRDLTIHLSLAPDAAQRPLSSLYLHCEDADELAAAWRLAGLEVVGPRDEEWGKREGSHVDPDGNLIRFGSPLR